MMRDAGGLLLHALLRLASGEGEALCRATWSEAWASNTFTGARHGFTLRLTGAGADVRAERLEAGIGEEEFALPGHLVADIVMVARQVVPGGTEIVIEALTVEAA